jgi:AcrR family transcriptional regulator
MANRKARGSGHERLAEILDAAKALFIEHGVENVSTRMIARQVGISQAALFNYYKNKDEVLTQLMQEAFSELSQVFTDVSRDAVDTRDWFRRCIAGYASFGLKHPDEYRLAFMVIKAHKTGTTQPTGTVQKIGMPIFLQLQARVAEAISQGVLRSDLGPPMLVAQALWASMHGLVALLIARPRPHFPWEDYEALIRTQTELLLDGVTAKRRGSTP